MEKLQEQQVFGKGPYTFVYGKKEQYVGEFSIYKEAILNGAIKMQKLQDLRRK